MAAMQDVENKLDELFVKKAPALPEGFKEWLVKYLPWINLVLGLFSLYSVYVIWHWAHYANNLINYANEISAAYGGTQIAADRLSVGIWIGLVFLTIETLLYIVAFPATRARKKSGWNLLFYALIVNVLYGVVMLFTSYGGFGTLLGSLIGTAIGLYILFQIRAKYLHEKAPAAAKKEEK